MYNKHEKRVKIQKSIKLRYLNESGSVKSLQKEVTIGMQKRLPWHFPSKMEEP